VLALSSYDYSVVRVVPRVDRGEFLNVGVILYCRTKRYLGARFAFDAARLAAFAPELDAVDVDRQLDALRRVCVGGAAGGPIGELAQPQRFHWLTALRSTVIQLSPVHCGLCAEPERTLETLLGRVVAGSP
jgi:hypothetical protein